MTDRHCCEVDLHEVKSTIRRDEGDGSVIFESCQPDTLVELHVLKIDSFAFAAPALSFKQHLQHILVVFAHKQGT